MNVPQKVIKNKFGIFGLAQQLDNLSEACKIMGYIGIVLLFKDLYEHSGKLSLQEISCRKLFLKKRIDTAIETKVACYLEAQNFTTSKVSDIFISQHLMINYSKVSFTKLYVRKNALIATVILNDPVVPFFDEYKLRFCVY